MSSAVTNTIKFPVLERVKSKLGKGAGVQRAPFEAHRRCGSRNQKGRKEQEARRQRRDELTKI